MRCGTVSSASSPVDAIGYNPMRCGTVGSAFLQKKKWDVLHPGLFFYGQGKGSSHTTSSGVTVTFLTKKESQRGH